MSAKEEFRDPKLTINRVYTKTGDAGTTRLVGGQKVSKASLRLEGYGTVDELNAIIGAARESCLELNISGLADDLLKTQHALFNLGSILATLPEDVGPRMPRVTEVDINFLEQSIDDASGELPALRSFVLPGGNRANTDLHLARTVCRRAERVCVQLSQVEDVDALALIYLNRLSDALFVWSRLAANQTAGGEVLWSPNSAH